MKRTEIEAIARQLVRFVETHPQCSRQEAAAIIPIECSTVHAWQIVQHLFDFDRSQGKKVRYSRNAKPFSFLVKTRTKKPTSRVSALAVEMQQLVDSSHGITGEQIRNVMSLDMTTFKATSRLVKANRRLAGRNTATYFPIGYKQSLEPTPAQIISTFKYAELAKYDGVILTQWRITPP